MYLVLEKVQGHDWAPPYDHRDPREGTYSSVTRIEVHKFATEKELKDFLARHNNRLSSFEVFEAKPLNVKTNVEISVNLS